MFEKQKTVSALPPQTVQAKARRADVTEYPRMVYKHNVTKDEHGARLDELKDLTVNNPVEFEAALADGWKVSP